MVNTVTPAARPFVIASIMLATFMAAIEGTIVATAMPSIVGQLGGFTYYSWVFSAFLLAQIHHDRDLREAGRPLRT